MILNGYKLLLLIHLAKIGGSTKLKENENSYEVAYKYDIVSDILGIKVNRDFQYDVETGLKIIF